jgi:hypothetical protein
MSSPKKVFLTFTNTAYHPPTRILEQAAAFGIFDTILHKTELDIPEFIQKHSEFIQNHAAGYGYYIWKPKIILDTLLNMEDGDLLFYCDSGAHLNLKGVPRFQEYLGYLDGDKSMVTFCMSDRHSPHLYVKQDAVQYYFPEFNERKDLKNCYAGYMILKKCDSTMEFLVDWLFLCEKYKFIDTSISHSFKELDGFQGNDKDAGLFNLVLAKHNIDYKITRDETNLYNEEGVQLHHLKLPTHPNEWPWSLLDAFPIHCRRDTGPGRYNSPN